MITPETDEELLIVELYDIHSYELIRYIYMLVNDELQSEDLLQETFIRAWKNVHRLNEIENPRAWLFKIAHNASMDYLRKKKPIHLIEKFIKSVPDPSLQPEKYIQTKEESRELVDRINNLKDRYRKIILLRKVHEFSIRETADILKWSESKVKTTLHRAMKSLEDSYIQAEEVYYEKKS
ncbi:RNA polymerase sigma factor [Geomicrobium sp. JSM 1781026]|uniref:RNA polymerase sigma factor n=1 Tax=Geomicrobium sp. JSM 1781026 TaxID=3344580 RepID=UPI0035BF499A